MNAYVCNIFITSILLFFLQLRESYSLENGLARLPPMGWSNWIAFRGEKCKNAEDTDCISENAIKHVANWLVENGYDKLGYEYIIMDDHWQSEDRDKEDRQQPDAQIFPNGMKALAKYVHDKNLKLGIFSDLGTKSGGSYPGSQGHLEIDANTFAEWDVDYIKMSAFTASKETLERDYVHFGECLKRTGRPILYATSWRAYAHELDYSLMAAHCNTWRFNGDSVPAWNYILGSMDAYANQQTMLRMAHSGAWNDADLLLAGVEGVTLDQAKAQLAVWSIIPSPLIFSANVDKLSSDMEAVLKNRRVIEVNQDSLAVSGYKFQRQGDVDVWVRPITPIVGGYHSFAIAFVNRNDTHAAQYRIRLETMGLTDPNGYVVSDLFSEPDSSPSSIFPSSELEMRINPSGVMMYKATALEGNKESSPQPKEPAPAVNQNTFPVVRYKLNSKP